MQRAGYRSDFCPFRFLFSTWFPIPRDRAIRRSRLARARSDRVIDTFCLVYIPAHSFRKGSPMQKRSFETATFYGTPGLLADANANTTGEYEVPLRPRENGNRNGNAIRVRSPFYRNIDCVIEENRNARDTFGEGCWTWRWDETTSKLLLFTVPDQDRSGACV